MNMKAMKTKIATIHLKRCFLCLGLAAGALAVTNCHTMEGVGEDVQHAGYHIEEASE